MNEHTLERPAGPPDDGPRDDAPRQPQAERAFGPGDVPEDEQGEDDGMWRALGSGVLFEQAMAQTRMAVCIADPHREDTPIVFANRAFLSLTGYPRDEVLGRNCRFLQGADTDRGEVARLREAIEREEVAVVELLNYRRDGSSFWNALHVGPIHDEEGRLLYQFGSQWDVSNVVAARAETQQQKILARELNHRIKNLFATIASIVKLSARGEPSAAAATEKALGRIMALARAHEATLSPAGSSGEPADLLALIETVLRPYRSGAPGRLAIEGRFTRLPATVVTPVGVVLHELATNAVKHGALGAPEGRVVVRWSHENERLVLEWREEGERVAEGDGPPGMGTMIMRHALGSVHGTIEREWRPEGLRAVVRVPLRED